VLVSQYASEPSHAHAYYLCIGSLLDKEQKGGDFFFFCFLFMVVVLVLVLLLLGGNCG
jgi:hypothetical protein